MIFKIVIFIFYSFEIVHVIYVKSTTIYKYLMGNKFIIVAIYKISIIVCIYTSIIYKVFYAISLTSFQ